MPSTALREITLEQYRRFYAEEIRTVANIDSQTLVDAFASVPRELFLGTPPWSFHSGPSLLKPIYRTTMDVRDIYHDVYVALRASQFLNNGQPQQAKLSISISMTSFIPRVLRNAQPSTEEVS